MRNVNKSIKLVALMAAASGMMLSSCTHESVYDPEYANKVLQQNWKDQGMGNIDPNQNWSMAESAKANMAIYGMDALSDYKLKLYTDNPLANDRAELIASIAVKTNEFGSAVASTPVDIKKGQTIFYACYEDSHNRRNIKPVGLINGEIDAIFGLGAATRGTANTDGLTIPTAADPSDAVNAKYAQAVEVDGVNSVDNWSESPTFAKVLKISAGNTWKGAINVGSSELDLGRTIYVDGTWDLTNATEQRIGGTGSLVVRPGGKILLGKDTKLVTDNMGRIVVMAGASIEGPGLFELANGTGADYCYNAGTIKVSYMNNNGGTLYNYGTMDVVEISGGAKESEYINWGKMFIDHNGRTTTDGKNKFNASNLCLKNACQLEVAHDFFARNFILGPSAYAHIGGNLRMELAEGTESAEPELLLAKGSLIQVDGAVAFNNVNIVGPTDGWAVCEFGQCGDTAPQGSGEYVQMNYESTDNLNVNKGHVINNLYITIDRPGTINIPEDYNNPRGNAYAAFTCVMMNGINIRADYKWNPVTGQNDILPYYLSNTPVGNGAAHLVNKSEANIVIPENDCTKGYNPVNPDPTPETPQTFIFACEDLGTSDDFDFNDIVFSVSYAAGETEATVKVLAAGGTLASELYYETTNLGEVHELLDAAPGEMINTLGSITNTHNGSKITVPSTWTLMGNKDKFVIHVKENGESSIVSNANVTGMAPQMIIVPGEWKWPLERVNIKDAYPQFVNWVGNASTTEWYKSYEGDKVVK